MNRFRLKIVLRTSVLEDSDVDGRRKGLFFVDWFLRKPMEKQMFVTGADVSLKV